MTRSTRCACVRAPTVATRPDSFRSPRFSGEVYVGPYLEFHPDLAWVVDNNGTASGYVLCAPDTRAFEERCERDWWPRLRERYPLGQLCPQTRSTRRSSESFTLRRRPPAEIVVDYPAHLHIDLVAEVQGLRLGGAMIGVLLDTLTARGTRGVHLGVGTANTRAIGFYEHLGFTTLGHDGTTTTMGKFLNPT